MRKDFCLDQTSAQFGHRGFASYHLARKSPFQVMVAESSCLARLGTTEHLSEVTDTWTGEPLGDTLLG